MNRVTRWNWSKMSISGHPAAIKFSVFQILEPRFKPIQVTPAATTAAVEQSSTLTSSTTQNSSVSSASSSSCSSAATAQKQILKLRSTTEQLDNSTAAADHHHRLILSPPQQLSNEEKLMEEFLNCVENSNQHFDFAENKMLSTPTTLSLGTIWPSIFTFLQKNKLFSAIPLFESNIYDQETFCGPGTYGDGMFSLNHLETLCQMLSLTQPVSL